MICDQILDSVTRGRGITRILGRGKGNNKKIIMTSSMLCNETLDAVT